MFFATPMVGEISAKKIRSPKINFQALQTINDDKIQN